MESSDVNGSPAGAENKDNERSGESEGSRYDAKTVAYMEDLLKEKHILSTTTYPIASRLLEEEVARTKQTGIPNRDYRYVDIFREKPVKVVAKVMVPIREYPKFNFVGKLLGPKGNTLRRLQEETLCKMTILGRGSMKDKAKEEELRKGLHPKYSHLSDDLHVEVSALAPPSEAHARMSYALKELRKYLIPDANDEISQEQLRELESYSGAEGGDTGEGKTKPYIPYRGKAVPGGPAPVGASKAKVMSILEKARNAMERGNSYHPPPVSHHQQNNYDRRSSTRNPNPNPRGSSSHLRWHSDRNIFLENEYFDGKYDEYPQDYESQRYEETPRGHWNSGYKMSTSTSRFPPRAAPYNRP